MLAAGSDGSVISGLIVSGFAGDGILVQSNDDVIEGSYIGTDAAGTSAQSNGADGILITGSGNTIGGLASTPGTGAGNLISGNSVDGIEITGTGTTGNVVAGNLIGTTISGDTALGNGSTYVYVGDDAINGGVLIDGGATGNLIGTSGQDGSLDTEARNIISGNVFTGVIISGADTSGNIVAGDYIGTTESGEAALGEGRYGDGVDIVNGASGNLIGVNSAAGPGTESADQGNLISGLNPNSGFGIWIDATSSGNVIAGNYLGCDATGTQSLGARQDVYIQGSGNLVGTSGQDGAADVLERNVITGYLDEGNDVIITGSSTVGNVVAGNYIGTNAAGTAGIYNGFFSNGVVINNGAHGNWIGVNTVYGPESSDQGNVIAGDNDRGTGLAIGGGCYDNVVAGNLIGTDATGSYVIPIMYEMSIGGYSNRIGTTGQDGADDALERNVISGWTVYGIGIGGSDNVFAGNYVGTNAAGDVKLNGGTQISISGPGNWIGVNPVYGPLNADEGNVIAGELSITGSGATGNVVAGNLIGINVNSQGQLIEGLGGEFAGVAITSGASGNWIGVNSAAGPGTENALERNVISGYYIQVALYNSGTTGNVLAGNLLGTDPTGTVAVPNEGAYAPESWGVVIGVGPTNNLVGTTGQDGSVDDALERNVISGNTASGVFIYEYQGNTGFPTTGNVVAGNFIGTTENGSSPLPNGNGVTVGYGASDNWVGLNSVYGAPNADQINVISGNTDLGVSIVVSGTTGNVVDGNLIGTNAAGSAAIPNGQDGVEISGGATGNTIGGTTSGAANVISGNTGDGVEISGSGTSGNLVSGN